MTGYGVWAAAGSLLPTRFGLPLDGETPFLRNSSPASSVTFRLAQWSRRSALGNHLAAVSAQEQADLLLAAGERGWRSEVAPRFQFLIVANRAIRGRFTFKFACVAMCEQFARSVTEVTGWLPAEESF
jgi:hypothetical protein